MHTSLEHFDLRVISLGAGVQSTTMYRMAALGMLLPKPDLAVFADTQAEPPWVYEHLDKLEADHGNVIPIRRVTAGSLEKNLFWGGEGRKGFAQIPAFLDNPKTGKAGMGRRQCTYQFKIKPIQKAVRDALGLQPRQRASGRFRVEQWIGISLDEAHRAKPNEVPWITNRWPLLFDRPMSRYDCLRWLESTGFPKPDKSSCYFCPFHSDRSWLEIKRRSPELWERACSLDEKLRSGTLAASKDLYSLQYLHSSLMPLRDVSLDEDSTQLDLFGNECEGMCGV